MLSISITSGTLELRESQYGHEPSENVRSHPRIGAWIESDVVWMWIRLGRVTGKPRGTRQLYPHGDVRQFGAPPACEASVSRFEPGTSH